MTSKRKKELQTKFNRIADIFYYEKQAMADQVEFARKPWWVQQAERGDYAADGSDYQPYEPDESEKERQELNNGRK